MEQEKSKIYRAFAYARLSKDDGSIGESNSISNQLLLIREYVSKHDNIILAGEFFDDGYSGINYDRPDFKGMMSALEQGEGDMVISKDLSRFGRNYIETGRYIEQVFPSMGVRFVAINDNVDTGSYSRADELIVPVKNLMNDTYCRDLSKKLRGQFLVSWKQGYFMGAFASYGYMKDPADKHKLILDEYASQVVRKIFRMKMEGYRNKGIAEHLNQIGEPAPADYKKMQGVNYATGFQIHRESKWDAMTIYRILGNRVYVGDLIQGRTGTLNYKVKKKINKNQSEWTVRENNHEKTVSREVFGIVQRIMERDVCSPTRERVARPLAGMLFCADCGEALVTRKSIQGNKTFSYFVCKKYKEGKGCTNHSIPVEKLERAVLASISAQIDIAVEMQHFINRIEKFSTAGCRIKRLEKLKEDKEKQIEQNEKYRNKLYEAKIEGMITQDEYIAMKKQYQTAIEEGRASVRKLDEEIRQIQSEDKDATEWLDAIVQFRGQNELSRFLVVSLIDKITVYEDKRIEITFNYKEEMNLLAEYMAQNSQEAV